MCDDADDTSGRTPDPEHAWKTLGLVNDWIRHGDAKIGVTLAATGAAGVTLFNLVRDQAGGPVLGKWFGAASAAFLLFAAMFAVLGLLPRVRVGGSKQRESLTNPLFYRHITLGWKGKTSRYTHVLGALTMEKQALTRRIGEQVHANAQVATRKFAYSNRSITALSLGILMLALTAIVAVAY